MRASIGVLTGAALSIVLVGACSDSAEDTVDATAVSADAAASDAAAGAGDAADGAMASGGVVSPLPENGNEAVDINGDTTAGQSAGSNSFTEGQARGHIENAGYTGVTGLTKTADGLWIGKAMKDGRTTNVSVDFKGAVTAQ
ncbi:MAG: hypothetical protein ACOY5Y_08695 [Pseudomonadota bacterium]